MAKKLIILGMVLVFVALAGAFAQNEPYVISFQGRVQGLTGQNSADIIFKLFDNRDGSGTAVWTEDHSGTYAVSIDPTTGMFNILLGNITPLANKMFDNVGTGLWLKVNVNGTDLEPLQPLTSAPYAFVAKGVAFDLSMSDPPGAAADYEGRMFYNNTSKRAGYSDGEKWIEIDPAYTTKPYNVAKKDSISADGTMHTMFTAAGPKGSIITNFGIGRIYLTNTAYYEIVLYEGSTEIFRTYVGHSQVLGEGGELRVFTLPIPIKVSPGSQVKMSVTSNSGETGSAYYVYINYINLPL